MNKYTQDMTGTGDHVELPDPEPVRYYLNIIISKVTSCKF